MAGKLKTTFVCNNCGYETVKWMGQCPNCSEWNTFEEVATVPKNTVNGITRSNLKKSLADAETLSNINIKDEQRFVTNISELDRVLGGGIVKGSVVLLSGDPGIGKSTILLQICQKIQDKLNILYV